MELDYPNEKKQPEALKKQNEDLKDKYKIDEFPAVLLMDAEGKVIAHTSYLQGGPEKYLEHLADLGKIYDNVIALKGRLGTAKGLDRAKMLDQLIEDYEKLNNDSDEVADWSKEIIALDTDNQGGLKVKYEFRQAVLDSEDLMKQRKLAEARDKLEKALATQGVPNDLRQIGYLRLFDCAMGEQHFIQAIAALKQAKQVDPKGKEVEMIDELIGQYGKMADAEETIKKLEPELPKSGGLDRAKLLDTLINAKQELPPNPDAVGDITKWTKEIISLDADNKAGLKRKYQFQTSLSDAAELAQAGKVDEARAAVSKALAMPGISGEDTQQGLIFKAKLAPDKNGAVDCMKKALAAAPESEIAPRLKERIAELDNAK